ncbi:transmembrane protein 150A-like isoform X2 [Denticeps clupeoides]|uniref:transmembrane protein 150A-like isoform X2 n=1 Tax=Denticeps clupeoides TaxID=299321 RepID=UPI0010A4ABEF|nr:transmembrane protein 150A-like isoform X2 [Denticeps clupeoides]
MSPWIILPISLPVITITGIYAMALYNQHVCPVDNWVYNESCAVTLAQQSGPELCCDLDDIPLISKCGALPPESCFFSLICSTGAFMVMLIGLLRYAHVIDRHQDCVLNSAGLSLGWMCAGGLIMVGNFQVDYAKVLHYVGAGLAFPSSMLFVCVQSALTYRVAKTRTDYIMGHLRLGMTLLGLVALLLSGVFFTQESSSLQHAAAIFEWLFTTTILLFYGSFAFEFGGVSGSTLLVLARGRAGVKGLARTAGENMVEVNAGANLLQLQPEGVAIL